MPRDSGVPEGKTGCTDSGYRSGIQYCSVESVFGSHPAVLGITEDVPSGYQRIFGDRIVDNAKGDGVENVLDLMTDRGYEATMKAAAAQKEMGADVIALSCTGMSSIRIAPSIEKTVGIPVLDPVLCEGLLTLFELLRRENMED
ncbi:MAG: aspartate/glutamate racemase family protein [Clostridium fessum]